MSALACHAMPFVAWMAKLETEGEAEVLLHCMLLCQGGPAPVLLCACMTAGAGLGVQAGIPPQPQLQPQYGYNVIVVRCATSAPHN